MNKVRIGIIGMGNMGRFHADYLINKKVGRCELTAVSDAFPANLERYKQFKTFESSERLIRSGEIDAVIIATPHYSHTTIGIDALHHGLHILVEKPISVHKADCERLIVITECCTPSIVCSEQEPLPDVSFKTRKCCSISAQRGRFDGSPRTPGRI